LTDARSLWQGAFTAVGTSTLTYAHVSEDGVDYENLKNAAHSPDEASRPWDYVVEAFADDKPVRTRYVHQPGVALSQEHAAARVTCPFPVTDFPLDAKRLRFCVTPRDVLGRAGKSLLTETFEFARKEEK